MSRQECRVALLIVIGACAVTRPVAAQEGSLTAAAVVAEALERNPDLTALRARVDVLRSVPAQQRALPPPTLEAQIWQWPITTLNPARTDMYMFMATQDLPGRGKRELKVAVAEKDIAVAETAVAARARELAADVRQAFAALSVARKADAIDRDTLALLGQLADAAQAKYETGRISQQDVLKAILEVSRLHEELLRVAQEGRLAAARLNVLRNRQPAEPIGPLADLEERELSIASMDLQAIAARERPELRSAQLQRERAEAALAVTRRDYRPDFSVQGGYMLMAGEAGALMARVGITWPRAPWARRGIDARVSQDAATLRATAQEAEAAANGVRLTVEDAYIRAQNAQQRAALIRTTILPQSQQTLDVSRVGYQSDRGDFLTLLDTQRMLLEAQLSYVRAVAEEEVALADLERAIGVELPPGAVHPMAKTEVR